MIHRSLPVRISMILLLLLCGTATAQQRDIQLSPREPYDYTIPSDIAIQSATAIGDRSLAVWGTMARSADGGRVNVLRGTMLIGGSPAGGVIDLNGASARPSMGVAVVAVENIFLVLWDDLRQGAPGIYSRRVDRDGALLGGEEFFAPGRFADDAHVHLLRDGAGYRVAWKEIDQRRDSYNFQKIDGSANRVGTMGTESFGDFDSVLTYSDLPGLQFYVPAPPNSSLPVRMIHPGGIVDARTTPRERFTRPFYLASDTSMVVMNVMDAYNDRSSIVIDFYGSVFDATPRLSISIDSIHGLIPNIGAITRNSAGDYEAIYAVSMTVDNPMSISPDDTFVRYFKSTIDANGSIAPPVEIASIRGFHPECTPPPPGKYYGTHYVVHPGQFIPGNDHRTMSITISMFAEDNAVGPSYLCSHPDTIFIDENGGVLHAETVLAWLQTNDLRQHFPIRRDTSIIVTIGGRETTITIDPAPNLPSKRESPVLLSRNGKTLVAWMAPSTKNHPKYFLLGRLDLSQATVVTPIDTESVNGFVAVTSSTDAILHRMNNAFFLQMFDRSIAVTLSAIFYSFSTNLMLPSDTAWRWGKSLYFDEYGDTVAADLTRDPNTGNVFGTYEDDHVRRGRIFFGMDSLGNELWSMQTVEKQRYTAVIPARGKEYVMITGNRAVRRIDTTVLGSFAIDTVGLGTTAHYERVLGDYFLRISAPGGLDSAGHLRDSRMALALYDFDGKKLRAATITAPTNLYDFTLMQWPKDSTIFIAWGSDHGIRLTVLDKNLAVTISDTSLSVGGGMMTSPSFLFQGDTIYAAWQDYRNGYSDIYGTIWPIPTGLVQTTAPPHDAPPSATKGIAIDRAVPLPAHDRVTFDITMGTAGAVTIELIDDMGRRTMFKDIGVLKSGKQPIVLSTIGMPPGVFTAVITAEDGTRATQRIIILK